jgi:hypothetical protein
VQRPDRPAEPSAPADRSGSPLASKGPHL